MATNKRRTSNYRLSGINPLSYVGVNPETPVNFYIYQRDPTSSDVKNFRIGDLWLNSTGDPPTAPDSVRRLWMLMSVTSNTATWHQFAGPGGGDITQMTADGPVVITPSGGNVNIFGTHNVNTSGSSGATVTVAGDNTITLGDLSSVTGSAAITLTTGDITLDDLNGSDEGIAKILFAPAAIGQAYSHIHFYLNGVFIGMNTGNQTMTSGVALFNTGIGPDSCSSLTDGTRNTAVGHGSFSSGTTAEDNVCYGYVSGASITTGQENTALGTETLHDNTGVTTGSYNTAVGFRAGSDYTSSESSNILIGARVLGTVGESNKLRIGTGTGVGIGEIDECYISGIDGVDVGSVATVVSHSGDQLGSATITAGTNISVTPGSNTITIASTGMGSFTWNEETGTSANMAVNNGYIANNAGLVTLTLPATAAVGDVIRVVGKGAGGWRIAQNAGQAITWDETAATTTGVGGMLDSTDDFDAVELVCMTANTDFVVLSSKGNISIT